MLRSVGLVLLLPSLASASDDFLHYGARAAGLSGAYTAVADDATAFYWNPAGYKFGPIVDAGAQWSGSGDSRSETGYGFAAGFTFMGVAATSRRQWVRTTRDPVGEQSLETFDLSVSILQSLPLDDLVVATNLHYLRGGGVGGERTATATLDVSALYEPVEWFRAGVMWRRLAEPSFLLASGDEVTLERHARAGVAFSLPRSTLVAVDVDLSRQPYGRELSVGIEKSFLSGGLALRSGVRADAGGGLGARPTLSVGAGGRIRWLVIDLAYETAADERAEHLFFGVTLSP